MPTTSDDNLQHDDLGEEPFLFTLNENCKHSR